jgi:hypothetical protein
VFPSLSLLAPSPWRQAEELVISGWAPSLVVRIAAPVGRRVDALVARTVAGLLDAPVSGPQHVLHVDDLVRFLVTAVEVEHTGAVDLGTADVIDAAAARHVLLGAEPRRGTRGIRRGPGRRRHWISFHCNAIGVSNAVGRRSMPSPTPPAGWPDANSRPAAP